MTAPPRSPWGSLLRAGLYGGLLYISAWAVILGMPATEGWDVFGEGGRLEVLQVIALGVTFGLALLTSLRYARSRPLAILLTGMFAAILVREFNNYLKDDYFHGLWQMIVGLVILGTLVVAWPWRRNIPSAITDLVGKAAFGWMASGFIVLVFAQLLDEREIWVLLLGPEFPYAARRMAEESVELLGYWLFAAGTIEYHLSVRRAVLRSLP